MHRIAHLELQGVILLTRDRTAGPNLVTAALSTQRYRTFLELLSNPLAPMFGHESKCLDIAFA